MKPLIATLLISLSGLCSENDVATVGRAASIKSDARLSNDPLTPLEWCSCALSVEENVFLQQYDFDPQNISGDRP